VNAFTLVRLKEKLEALPVVEAVSLPGVRQRNLYYGMNVSPSLEFEPLDQLDGFLVAKCVQNESGGEFFPFIAGVYEVFNAKSEAEARTTARRKTNAEGRKKQLLENIMMNLGLKGRVYTTYELWGRDDYWRLFNEVVDALDREAIESQLPPSRKGGVRMRDFPAGIMGNYQNSASNGRLAGWPAGIVYVPAEVAEALWFMENCGVGFKTGPDESESVYDGIIRGYGLGTIGLTQPGYFEGVGFDGEKLKCPGKRKAVPYIGKRGQNRVLLSDSLVDITLFRNTGCNPSYDRALDLCETYRSIAPEASDSIPPAYRIMRLINLAKAGDGR